MPGDWSTYLDVPNLLNYINNLYKGPNNIVRSESVYYSKMQEDQEKKAEIQAWVQQIQANAEMEIQQQQQLAQQWMEQQMTDEGQAMAPAEGWENADMQAALQQMFWW